ncbi:hypothetical protein M378DRAFT_166359 [Amanita muscaria Koide BX008]|uniref:Uncharacterized protein n=1 Tax=Amanita muscaria (strain Koide BX008) TaxID=946122 RepID=A0A0C2WYF2_AMAMK|nr:hypothetical protein M378DRAFT_166359 [Amanita muscaria Koide BX008]
MPPSNEKQVEDSDWFPSCVCSLYKNPKKMIPTVSLLDVLLSGLEFRDDIVRCIGVKESNISPREKCSHVPRA